MANIKNNLTELVGNTPLVRIPRFSAAHQHVAEVVVKLELFNPGGSVKDRIALAMLEDAEARGVLTAGSTIIEPTSGNTGIGIAWVGAVKGYRVILTMPSTMSVERQNLLKALRAELVLTDGALGMKGAIAKAEELQASIEGGVILRQFDNPANPAVHARTTAEEIWRDTDGVVDMFVGGVGTGGTISGTGQRLKALNPDIRIVAVEPDASAVLSGEAPGKHKIQGIGAGFVPNTYNGDVVDQVIRVSDDDAIRTSREVAQQEGLLVGISSGAALFAASQLAQQPENAGKRIVVVLPDTGERYLSTLLYAFDEYPLD
ncbi:MAG: cysteine synthase A [Bacteroidales bacterium]|nr:cysteine synthase A [Bacteroidales bacterium]